MQLKLYACHHPDHTETTLRDCDKCGDFKPMTVPKKLKWSYGVTTVIDRRKELFPRTLASLAKAGFPYPHVFVDGDDRGDSWREKFPGLAFTLRNPKVRTAGHWVLSIYELYIRNPDADRYALFQDDLICVQGLKEYLERASYPENGYLNLFTFSSNHDLTPKQDGKYVTGWFKGRELASGPAGFQTGRGAVALVFSREALGVLLTSQHLFERPKDPDRGWRAVDGGIVSSMNKAGWFEYVHHPSLVWHTGMVSTMGNRTHPQTKTFPGENFDAKNLREGATQCEDWGI